MASAFSGVVWTSFMAPQVPKRKKGKLPVLSKNKPMSAGAALPLYLIVQSPCRLAQILGKGHGPVSSWRRNQKLWGIFNLTHFSLSCLISDEICFLLHSLPFSFPSFPLLLFIYIYIYSFSLLRWRINSLSWLTLLLITLCNPNSRRRFLIKPSYLITHIPSLTVPIFVNCALLYSTDFYLIFPPPSLPMAYLQLQYSDFPPSGNCDVSKWRVFSIHGICIMHIN